MTQTIPLPASVSLISVPPLIPEADLCKSRCNTSTIYPGKCLGPTAQVLPPLPLCVCVYIRLCTCALRLHRSRPHNSSSATGNCQFQLEFMNHEVLLTVTAWQHWVVPRFCLEEGRGKFRKCSPKTSLGV